MDITESFFNIVKECQDIKSLIIDESSNNKKSNNINIEPITFSKLKPRKWKPQENEMKDDFLKQAYQIEKKIYQLQNFLISIRKSYLNITHLNSSHNMPSVVYFPFVFDDDKANEAKSIAIQNMTDRQRDDIDNLSKQYIKSCETQIKNLNSRINISINSLNLQNKNYLFLKKKNNEDEIKQMEVIIVHREAIIYSLNTLLMKVANILKDHQERRLEQNLQKRESLVHKPLQIQKSNETMLTSKLNSTTATPFKFLNSKIPFTNKGTQSKTATATSPTLTASSPSSMATSSPSLTDSAIPTNDFLNSPNQKKSKLPMEEENEAFDMDDIPMELKMQLEEENKAMLEELESDMNQVRQATQSINEISQLQVTLGQQLEIQQNIIETLHEDSWKAVDTMRQANQKLLSAQRHFSDRRVWSLVFLVVASLLLLFLDWFNS